MNEQTSRNVFCGLGGKMDANVRMLAADTMTMTTMVTVAVVALMSLTQTKQMKRLTRLT